MITRKADRYPRMPTMLDPRIGPVICPKALAPVLIAERLFFALCPCGDRLNSFGLFLKTAELVEGTALINMSPPAMPPMKIPKPMKPTSSGMMPGQGPWKKVLVVKIAQPSRRRTK